MNADYQFRLPKFLGYSWPVSLVCITVATISVAYSEYNKFVSYAIAIFVLLFALGYIGLFNLVKRFTNLERRLSDRDLLLNQIPWNGSESVLDIGCGNGILLLSAAKRLSNGRAIGIDIWTENSGDNKKEKFEKNAEIEGVHDRVDLQMEDARNLPYNSDSFDVILCGLTMHHLLHDTGSDKAVNEMVRVLRPGGYIAVYDVPMAIYSTTKLLKQKGIKVNKISSSIIIGIKAAKN